jgi:hypothetical protein
MLPIIPGESALIMIMKMKLKEEKNGDHDGDERKKDVKWGYGCSKWRTRR